MRTFALILLLLAIALPMLAQAQPNDVAHGSEKASAETAHPGEDVGGPHEGPKFLGLPAWIWKLANMLLFIGVLVWLLGGPAKKFFGDRNAQIRGAADEAKTRRAKADQLATDIQARLTQIEADVRAIHERAEAEGERQRRELKEAADAEAQRILTNARAEVDNRLKHARHELTEYAGELAAQRAEQIVKEKITPADQKKIFDESVREVAEVKG
ncbi:MAG TPA: ATP synthase F0 subunit B [Thermoanaerobaculia bacterium]|nr:ATP synthase F0 subunit B [Thermoanaerobaculia bacterium]